MRQTGGRQASGSSPPYTRIQLQTANNLTALQVRLNDLVHIGRVHVGVPNAFRVHDSNRTASASIQAPRFVYPHSTNTVQTSRAHCALAMVESILRLVL
jgi:hypothetical protein